MEQNKGLTTHPSSELSIADDFLIQVADQAEKRIDAVMKIKRVALKVTNPRDWTDQQGNPYLQASGSEKIANLFNISWRIDEPTYDEDPDGHYTYAYKGYFSLGSRSIEAEGSRSSRDTFFMQYRYEGEGKDKKRIEIGVRDRANKRDVKMAALTNLLGNGITRILGIRNLTWADLKEFANITQEQVASIQYKKGGKEPVPMPGEKKQPNGQTTKPTPNEDLITEPQRKRFYAIAKKTGATDQQIKDWLKEVYGLEHTGDIPKASYDEVCEKVQKEFSEPGAEG